VTGQPVTAAIVVARFHRPPFLIRAVSILFTFAEKVCALSWFTQERKEFYFYITHFCRDERTQITQITKSLAFFGVWRRKEISPHSFSCCRSDARPAGLKHKHTHKRTRLTTERYYKDGEEDEREEIADGWWCRWWWCGETETLHEHGKQNERKRARELAKKRGDRETIENVQTTTDTR